MAVNGTYKGRPSVTATVIGLLGERGPMTARQLHHALIDGGQKTTLPAVRRTLARLIARGDIRKRPTDSGNMYVLDGDPVRGSDQPPPDRDYQDDEWLNDAACIGYPPEWWTGAGGIAGGNNGGANYPHRREAADICGRCPVTLECLRRLIRLANSNGNLAGIYAGVQISGNTTRVLAIARDQLGVDGVLRALADGTFAVRMPGKAPYRLHQLSAAVAAAMSTTGADTSR